MDMTEEEKKKSFWETLPGIITAIGGLLTGLGGVAAVITALNSGGKESGPKPDAPAAAQSAAASAKTLSADNDAAQRAAELERKLAEVASAQKKAEEEAVAAKAELARIKAEAARQAAEEEQAKAEEAAPKQGDVITDDFTGMKLAYVPGGCFMMGQTVEDKQEIITEGGQEIYDKYFKDVFPRHKVCVDGFWMGQYEVTQGQWEKVMGENPSLFKKGSNYPVDSASWDETQGFIKKLNSSTCKSYRLPTEAEWEYACRAGGSDKYCGGDDVDAVAWYEKNSDEAIHAVGGKKANGFSLYDMSGNLSERCADWYDSGYYASSPQSNPVGPESGWFHVIRGGGWLSSPWNLRAACRLEIFSPDFGYSGLVSFRLVLPVQQGQAGD